MTQCAAVNSMLEERRKKAMLQTGHLVAPVNCRHSAGVSLRKRCRMNSTFHHLISLYCIVFIALARLAHCYKVKL